MKFQSEDGIISEEMRTIIRNTNDLMFVKNKDFKYVEASHSFVTDCAECEGIDDVIGKTDFDIFGDEAIARKYRDDDEKLFESGKAMVEFQDALPNRKGEKHICLMTKYLIYDNDGNPVGIFGQYHDIAEQMEAEILLHQDINRKIVNALNRIFLSSNYIDLKTGNYTIIQLSEYSKKALKNISNIDEAFEIFISKLVSADCREKMREFCRTDNVAERLKGKSHIDCEYISEVMSDWCQASFIPAEWDENGEVTHVLFVVSDVDTTRAREIEEGISSRNDLETIFDEVPGGIVMYRWTGSELITLKMSKYYEELYDYSMLKNNGSPDFERIHPDDVRDYEKAYFYALEFADNFEYVYRVWNEKRERYVWTKINAVAHRQPDGTALIYAMYSDVTAQKDAEQELAKSRMSLISALGASNQLGYEYDPVEHTGQCLTEENFFDLPKHIENYPDAFRDMDLFHPDDVETFISTAHLIDGGCDKSHCDVRIKKNGEYFWYSCMFFAYFDSQKERRVAILSVLDITLQMNVIQSYRDRLTMLENANKDAMCMCDVNVSNNTFSNIRGGLITKEIGKNAENLNQLMEFASARVHDDGERKKYLSAFNCRNLLERFEKGENQTKMEHFYSIEPNYTERVETVFDLVEDPVSGDVLGLCYAKSLNTSYLSRILLDTALEKDYPIAALVYVNTGEYYLYETDCGEYCRHKQDYWEMVHARVVNIAEQNSIKEVRDNLSKQKVISELEENNIYSYAFYGFYHGEKCRMEASFKYADSEHGLVIATLRNITDEALYRQYKHDSEHDALTGLFNRETLFRKCRQLLTEHPDEQFVILHGNVRHFHLYNTFFGDEGGDRLLCDIADRFREMDDDYDFWAFGRIEADVFCAFFPFRKAIFERHIHYLLEEIPKTRNDFLIEPVIGIYRVTDPEMSVEAMFTRATVAAKSGKKNYMGLISEYDDEMDHELKNNQQIMSEMQTAFEDEQFEVYLQPKYSLRNEKLVGAEALVRWNHPEKGIILPGSFIPLFESNGCITQLDQYIWEKVCRLLRRWQDEGRPMYPVSVNVSRISMYIQSTVPFLIDLVTKYGIDPKYLEIELTETAYMDDPQILKRMLYELKAHGFTILMDDFGSGYSSLTTLRELPVDILKLDTMFLSESQNDSRGNAVLSSVVRMSKMLGLPVVAEGVEKPEQAAYLRSIGCEYVQGFLFAKPMPVADYEKKLDAASDQAEGECPGNYGITQDNPNPQAEEIEELQKRIAELEKKLSFFGSAIENMPNPVFIKDHDARFVFFNERYAEIFGMTKEKYLGGTVMELDYLPEEDRRKYQKEDLGLIEDGGIRSYDMDFLFNDGKIHPSYYWSKGFVCNDTGEHGLVGEIVDISEERADRNALTRLIRGTAYMFEFFYVIDLENELFVNIERDDDAGRLGEITLPLKAFYEETEKRFYNPINNETMEWYFTKEGMAGLLSDRDDYYFECCEKLADTKVYGITLFCVERVGGIPSKVIYTARDITEAKKKEHDYRVKLRNANERLRDMAYHDGLTNLYNRRGLMEAINVQLTDDSKVALLLIDVDHFKNVNDSFGHQSGDRLLIKVADLLRASFRTNDILARLGGDEFIAVLMDCDYEHGDFIAGKIKAINEELCSSDEYTPEGSVSVGVAFSRNGEKQELYDRADLALYRVKNNGRCGCCIYEDEFKG